MELLATQLMLFAPAVFIGAALTIWVPSRLRMPLLAGCGVLVGVALIDALLAANNDGNRWIGAIRGVALILAIVIVINGLVVTFLWVSGRRVSGAGTSLRCMALLSGLCGAASVAVVVAEYLQSLHLLTRQPTSLLEAAQQLLAATAMQGDLAGMAAMAATGLALLLGSVSCTGALTLCAGRQGISPGMPLLTSALLLAGALMAMAWLVRAPTTPLALWLLLAVSLLLGVSLLLPVDGGTGRPVALSLLNAGSGIAVALAGVAIDSHLMIVTGALIAGAGIALSQRIARVS